MTPTPASLTLPDDHAELLAFARKQHPDLTGHRHASDAVVAQRPDTKQFVHVRHDQLRAGLARARQRPDRQAQ